MNYDSILIRHEMSGFETEQNIGKIIERERGAAGGKRL